MALLVRFNPWLGTAHPDRDRPGLARRGSPATATGCASFYFGDNQFNLGIESLFIARQFIGAVSIFALGILARWLVVHGHLDRIYRRLPARLGVSSFLVLMLPSIALLYWVEKGTFFTNPLLFTVYDFVLMLVLVPALLLAARPAAVLGPARCGRSASWLGERSYSIYLWHFPIILAIYERGPLRRLPAAEAATGGGCPLILVLTLVFATVSYHAGRAARHGVGPPPGQARLRRPSPRTHPHHQQGARHVMKLSLPAPPVHRAGRAPPRPYVGEELSACSPTRARSGSRPPTA